MLFPDTPEDRGGVYSGCGFVKEDTLYLFYTGNVKEPGDHDYIKSGRLANVILVTTKDGVTMSPKKVLLRNSDYPPYCSCHVRDPKVWEEGGSYRMVLGARTLDDRGCVLYYRSDDLEHWEFNRTLFGEDGSYMWECPDEFTLGNARFLSASPQGAPHGKYGFQNVYSAGYFTLGSKKAGDYREWDKGFDFYAPQTFDAPDGRKILIGWEGIGDIPYTNPTAALGWQHCLTLPRELSLSPDGCILQQPVRELERLRSSEIRFSGGWVETPLPFEFVGETGDGFVISLGSFLELKYEKDEFSLEFTGPAEGCGRDIRRAKLQTLRSVRIIADRSSVEVYLNGGEVVFSTRMYPGDTSVTFSAEGVSGKLYALEGMRFTYDEK